MSRKPARIIRGKTDPPPAKGERVVIIGSRNDNRAQSEWKLEDGLGWYNAKQCVQRRVKSGGARCGNRALKAKNGCRDHAGGDGHPVSHGMYATGIVGRLLERFEAHESDAALFDTRKDVALIGAAAETLLEQGAKFGDTPEFRKEAYRRFSKMRTAGSKGDTAAFDHEMRGLGALLREGYDTAKALQEGIKLVERRAYRAERAREVAVKEENSLTDRDVSIMARIIQVAIYDLMPETEANRLLDTIDRRLPDGATVQARAVQVEEDG